MFNTPMSYTTGKLIVDGKSYRLDKFRINFHQPSDFKFQPQHETRGGLITVSIDQVGDAGLYNWAKSSTERKSGSIIFQGDMGSVLTIVFTDAYCINLTREISAVNGTTTTLIISPKKVSLNGIEHDNNWV